MLNISHLTKAYGEKKAVDDLSLHYRSPARFTASSATTARARRPRSSPIAGILQFDAGEIYHRRRVG